MATSLHRVWENFVWRIGAKTPTASRAGLRGKFVHLNGAVEPGSSSGTGRGFNVKHLGQDFNEANKGLWYRIAPNHYLVEVYYPIEMKQDALEEVAAQDAHDIIAALEDPASWLGFNSANTSDDVGIMNRVARDGYEVSSKPAYHTLSMKITAIVKELI